MSDNKNNKDSDDFQLWQIVKDSVVPIKRKSPNTPDTKDVAPIKIDAKQLKQIAAKKIAYASTNPRCSSSQSAGTIQAIETNLYKKIAKGRIEIDAKLDLHEMNQDQAIVALRRFLARSKKEGHRTVLIITGKGRNGNGVLRARLPQWVRSAEFSNIIGGIESADHRHGGEGAFYLRIKKERKHN